VAGGDLARDRIRKCAAEKELAGVSRLVLKSTTEPGVELQPARERPRQTTSGGYAARKRGGRNDPNPVAALDEKPAQTDCGWLAPPPLQVLISTLSCEPVPVTAPRRGAPAERG
jgi:hypothetical protein